MKAFAKTSGVMIRGPLLMQVVNEVNTGMLLRKIELLAMFFGYFLGRFSNSTKEGPEQFTVQKCSYFLI
jgi:hypothetical protein